MKKIFCSVGLITAFYFGSLTLIFCQTVSLKEAEKVAINFMKTQHPQAQIVASTGTSSGAENRENDLIHVFNFQPSGFVLVAGDKKSTPVLGFSKESNFDVDRLNPEAVFYLNAMKSQVSFLKTQKSLPSMQADWEQSLKANAGAESGITVGPYLTTKWNQGQYYNQYCPADATGPAGHVYTGCVATAMAQLIKFHNSPAYGQGYHEYYHGKYGWQSANFESAQYNWANMPDVVTSSNPDVARLMYHCGVAVDMDYGVSGSSAAVSAIAPALQNYFSFSNSMQWITYFLEQGNFGPKILADLNSGHPTYMTGCGSFTGDCHAWICDGYQITPNFSIYYSMNWGWGGNADGYYMLGNFNTGSYSFDWHLTAITGISPSCPRNVNINSAPLAALPIIEVIETITTNMPIVPVFVTLGNRINYDAGRYIQMDPGFQAEGTRVTFRAYIQGCGGGIPFTGGTNDDRSQPEAPESTSVNTDLQISPNPFTTVTTITYILPTAQTVNLQIFNAMGTLVAQPVRQAQQEAGQYEHTFEANNLPPGIYFLVLHTGNQKQTKRLVLNR